MIFEGKPAWLPWTSPSLHWEAENYVAQSLSGGAVQQAGTTFARAIRRCPGCQFAAMDLATGLVVATSSVTYREMALAFMRGDGAMVASWYRCNPQPGGRAVWPLQFGQCGEGVTWPGNSKYSNWPQVYPWTTYSDWTVENAGVAQSWTFGERQTMSQFITTMLGRRGFLLETGVVLWFPGVGRLRWWAHAADIWEQHIQVVLPALCIYGFWGIPEDNYVTPTRPDMRKFCGWLNHIGNGVEDPKTIAAVVDEHHYAVAMRTAPKG